MTLHQWEAGEPTRQYEKDQLAKREDLLRNRDDTLNKQDADLRVLLAQIQMDRKRLDSLLVVATSATHTSETDQEPRTWDQTVAGIIGAFLQMKTDLQTFQERMVAAQTQGTKERNDCGRSLQQAKNENQQAKNENRALREQVEKSNQQLEESKQMLQDKEANCHELKTLLKRPERQKRP